MDQDERERTRGRIGQGKGMRKGKGKGKGEIDEQKDWEKRWRVKEESWMNEQWGRMSDDDLRMEQTGQRLRQEQWEAVRAMKLRSEMPRMAECLGEKLGKGSRRRVRDLGMERRRESHRGGESPAEHSGYDSVEEKIRRLTQRIDELEGRMAKGSSSESDESSERWKWDGRVWWYKVECKGSLNSRLRRRVSRAVSMALEQESERW